MAETVIYLVRHGEVEMGGGKRLVGQVDPPLSEKGREQAHTLRHYFNTFRLDRIYCSDLIRCVETARIIASPNEESIELKPGLRGINFGVWDGQEVEVIKKRFPDEWGKREQDLVGHAPLGGESFVELSRRVVPHFVDILEPTDRRVLIVAHAAVNRVILTHVLGMPIANLSRLQQDYGSFTLMAYKNGEWRLLALNTQPSLCALPV